MTTYKAMNMPWSLLWNMEIMNVRTVGAPIPSSKKSRTTMAGDSGSFSAIFPLTQIHPLAEPAAETAELAGAHGRFWEMHDGIYENQDRLSLKLLLELGELLGLSGTSVRDSIADNQFLPKIRKDLQGGVRSGVNGTPTFFINGVRHDGLYEFEDLVSAIDARMLRAKQSVA